VILTQSPTGVGHIYNPLRLSPLVVPRSLNLYCSCCHAHCNVYFWL